MYIGPKQRMGILAAVALLFVSVGIFALLKKKAPETKTVNLELTKEQTATLRERLERLELLRFMLTDETFQRIPQDLDQIAAQTPPKTPTN